MHCQVVEWLVDTVRGAVGAHVVAERAGGLGGRRGGVVGRINIVALACLTSG